MFSRHETFAPRAGWLKKGFEAARESNGQVFTQEDAQVRLGVGKNMAREIHYWCHAFRLLVDQAVPGERVLLSRPTPFGERLLGEHGWDPFLEDTASLWYLHWQLIRSAKLATAWHYAFTLSAERESTLEQLSAALQAHVRRLYPTSRAVDSSLHKDVLCIARMYGESSGTGAITEDTIHCPFAELGLLRPGAEPRSYRFNVGAKADLPDTVIIAACLEYAAFAAPGVRRVAIGRLLFEPGSPGMALKLTESTLTSAIEKVALDSQAVMLFWLDADGKNPTPLADIPAGFTAYFLRWADDSRTTYVSGLAPDGRILVYGVPAAGGALHEVAHSEGTTFQTFRYGFEVRGGTLYISLANPQSDIWTAELVGR